MKSGFRTQPIGMRLSGLAVEFGPVDTEAAPAPDALPLEGTVTAPAGAADTGEAGSSGLDASIDYEEKTQERQTQDEFAAWHSDGIGPQPVGGNGNATAASAQPEAEEPVESDVADVEAETPAPEETTVQVEVTPMPSGARYQASAGDIAPWALLGVLAGCILGAAAWGFLSKMRNGTIRPKQPRSLKVVTLQGLGARENQQDALAATDPDLYPEQGALLCVADGMGGLQNGSLLSRTAVTAVINKFQTLEKTDPERVLAILLQTATAAVNTVLSPNYGKGGTTLLLGYACQGLFYCASVGDSRICLLRDGKLIHLNRPHIFEDELLLRYINGELSYESARNYEKKGGLTSYLGMGQLKYVDFPTYHVSIQKGDRFILMSDGVFNTLSDEEIAGILRKKPKMISTQLNRAIEKKQARFQDNYSAAVLIAE